MIHYQNRWAVVTGASSGLGRGIATRLADRDMSLVLTGRNELRLNEAAQDIRRASPKVKVETVAADLSSPSGISALLDHVGGLVEPHRSEFRSRRRFLGLCHAFCKGLLGRRF